MKIKVVIITCILCSFSLRREIKTRQRLLSIEKIYGNKLWVRTKCLSCGIVNNFCLNEEDEIEFFEEEI